MSFWTGLGNWLGNAVGWNQAQAAQQGRAQEQQGVAGQYGVGGQAQQFGSQAAGAAQGQQAGINSSLGANSGQTIQNATNAAMPVARTVAEQTGNAAGRQTLSAARTAGLNKGQAALEGGQAAGSATAAALPGALQSQIGNYMTATGQRMGYQQNLAGQGLGGYGTAAGAYGSGAQTSSGYSGEQGKQGLQGATQVESGIGKVGKLAGFAKGGVTKGLSLAGEAGPEVVIPVRKLLRDKKTAVRVADLLRKEIAEDTGASRGASVEELLKRIEALEKSAPKETSNAAE